MHVSPGRYPAMTVMYFPKPRSARTRAVSRHIIPALQTRVRLGHLNQRSTNPTITILSFGDPVDAIFAAGLGNLLRPVTIINCYHIPYNGDFRY